MRMKLGLAASAIALTVATLAYAQGNVIEERQNLMKANGAAMGVVVPMARGEAAFDAAAAQQAFATIADDMTAFPALFPEGSEARQPQRSGRIVKASRHKPRRSPPTRRRLPSRSPRSSNCRPRSARSALTAAPATRPIATDSRPRERLRRAPRR